MIKIPLKMNRHKKNQIEIKIDNFSQKGLSSSGEISRSTFSKIKKEYTLEGGFEFLHPGSQLDQEYIEPGRGCPDPHSGTGIDNTNRLLK